MSATVETWSHTDHLARQCHRLDPFRAQMRTSLESVDGHMRAIIVYAKSGSELEATARDARKAVELALSLGRQWPPVESDTCAP